MQTCKLCLSSIQDNESTFLDGDILERLEFLQISLEDNEEKNFLCSQCDENIENIFDFKSCVVINAKLNARNIKGMPTKNSTGSTKCHLCKNYEDHQCMISLTKLLKDDDRILEVFQNNLQEVDLQNVENSMVCEGCQKSLIIFWSLIESWWKGRNLSIDEMTDDDDNFEDVALKEENVSYSVSVVNSKSASVDSDDNRMIKNGNSKKRQLTLGGYDSDDNKKVNADEILDGGGGVHISTVSVRKEEIEEIESAEIEHKQLKAEEIEIKDEDELLEDYVRHPDKNNEVQIFKYDKCPSESLNKYNMKNHLINPNQLAEVQMYKCNECSFETRHETSLKRHMLIHKSLKKVKMFKCKECSFGTKHKRYLKGHMVKHRSLNEIQMYKCKECFFETRYKRSLKKHDLLFHKSLQEIQIYKCRECSYKTKYKGYLTSHKLKHRNLNEIQMYKCKECSYETKRKGDLNSHLLIHKSLDEVQMFKCKECSFETKHKKSLAGHFLKHRSLEEVQIYKCRDCSYNTKRKGCLKIHMLKHRSLDEIQMYKCNECSYETKFKNNLKTHLLKHKSLK